MESVLSGVEPARRRVCAIASAKAFSIVLEPSIRNARESVLCEGIGSSVWLNLAWYARNWKRDGKRDSGIAEPSPILSRENNGRGIGAESWRHCGHLCRQRVLHPNPPPTIGGGNYPALL